MILALLMSLLPAAEGPSPTLTRLPMANDALALARADTATISPSDRPFMRWVWVRGGVVDAKMVSLTMNMVSRGTVIQRPLPITNGKTMVLRCDLRAYAPREKDLAEWLTIWEELQFDPAFSLLLTKGTLRFAAGLNVSGKGWVVATKEVLVERDREFTGPDGQKYRGRWESSKVSGLQEVNLRDLKDVELIRVPGRHVNAALWGELASMTGSQAPVVSADYLTWRMLSQIRDKGVRAQIYGGLYYDFVGIKRAKKGTDEDLLLESLGVGNINAGITANKIFDNLRSDQRIAIFRSKVTGKPRRADFFRTLAGRIDLASGLISVTHDIKDEDVDIDTHPVANLLDFRDQARELIFEKQNGLHGYAALNGAGKLQDEVPFDVANDSTIPHPHTQRLQPAISCIACHEADGSDGWKPAPNDVQALVKARPGSVPLDIFGDTTNTKATIPDTLDRLAGLYQGQPERALARGRDDYAAAVLRATGPMPVSKRGQADVVKLAAEHLTSSYQRHAYDLVTPGRALIELGIECDPRACQAVLNDLVPPDRRAATSIFGLGQIVPEDPRIAALKAGIPISRTDFDLAYSFMANRVQASLAKQHDSPKKGDKR